MRNVRKVVIVGYFTLMLIALMLYWQRPKTDTVVVALHAGGWNGETPLISLRRDTLLQNNVCVVEVGYKLGTKKNPSAIQACTDVWRAVIAARQRRGVKYVHLYGESAGGHIALLCAYMGCPVDSVIAVSAPTDLTIKQPEKIYDKAIYFVGGGCRASVSPCHIVCRAVNKLPPTLLIHGEDDEVVFKYHTETLYDALIANDAEHTMKIVVGGRGHYIGDPVTDIVQLWLRNVREEN